ncbi:MAG: class I SAM-dependent methyltransferase [Novipirellula sp. JB048]
MMNETAPIDGYVFNNEKPSHTQSYLLPAVIGELELFFKKRTGDKRVFELGCGNGANANSLAERGYTLTGVDPSLSGIEQAKLHYPELDLHTGSAYDPLSDSFGTFPVVISLEVVEHVYAPRQFARCVFDLLEPGGLAIISTPYHGYLKNLALAVFGKMDAHYTALWDHGHIKFWSVKTISSLLREAGLDVQKVIRVGRCPPVAKSMIVLAVRP